MCVCVCVCVCVCACVCVCVCEREKDAYLGTLIVLTSLRLVSELPTDSVNTLGM